MSRLGKHQLCLLASLASPFLKVIVGDRLSRSLVRRGLMAPHWSDPKRADGLHGITPAGLRALADALERGDLEQFLDPRFQRDRARLLWDVKDETGGKR